MEALKQKVLWQAIDVLEQQEFDFTARLRLPYYLFMAIQGSSYFILSYKYCIFYGSFREKKKHKRSKKRYGVCTCGVGTTFFKLPSPSSWSRNEIFTNTGRL